MLGSDTDDRLCAGLVNPRDLVEKDKGKLVIFVRNLDHVAIDRIEVLRYIDSNLILGHTECINRCQIKAF
jgi:hypothetical protein